MFNRDGQLVIVLGAAGMLGRAVVTAAHQRGLRTLALQHTDCDLTQPHDVFDRLRSASSHNPVAIINCAGVIPVRSRIDYEMVAANAVAPHIIARYAADRRVFAEPVRVIHVSTDCVFSGIPDPRYSGRRYWAEDRPDPTDLYGRSKLAGEVSAPHVLNVRTSFIGPRHGLWAWLAAQPEGATVEGWANAMWTGSTVQAVAAVLVDLSIASSITGVVHLATLDKLSKYDVLLWLAIHLGRLDVQIERVHEPRIDRALLAEVPLPSLSDALEALSERTPVQAVAHD